MRKVLRFAVALIFKANFFHWVFFLLFLWLGLIFLGLGRFPHPDEWGIIVYSIFVATFTVCITEFADIYADRFDDKIFRPANPLASGEISHQTGKKIFILENILGIVLLVSLYILTKNLPLILALTLGWISGLAYSLPPLKLKERKIIGPVEFGFCCSLLPLVGWLIVKPLTSFILAYMLILFIGGIGVGIATKLRRTSEALNYGLFANNPETNPLNLKVLGFSLKVKTAIILEAIFTIGAVILIPVFYILKIFNPTLTILLLLASTPPVLAGITLRIKNPIKDVKHSQKTFTIFCLSLPLICIATFIAALITI